MVFGYLKYSLRRRSLIVTSLLENYPKKEGFELFHSDEGVI